MKRKSHIMGLYTDGFRQVWSIGFMGAAAAAVCAVAESPYGPAADYFQGIQAVLIPFRLLYLAAVAVMVFRLFSFMGNRQAVDFYFSAPIKRRHIYTANVMAAVTWIVILTGAYMGARFITDWFLPGMGSNITNIAWKFLHGMWGWCLSVFGTCLLVLGGCCLGVTVAGGMAGGAALTAVILLLPVILRVTFLGQLGQSMEFVPMEHSVWIALDTTYGLLYRSYDVQTEDGALMLSLMLSGLYSGCIGMACCAAGDLVYRRRKGETALRSAGKRILALGGGIVLTAAAMTAVFAAAAFVIPRLEAAITPEGKEIFSVSIYDVTDVADMAEIYKDISLDSPEVQEVVRGAVQEELNAFRRGQEYYQNWLGQQGGEVHTVILRGENGPLYRDIHFRAAAYGKLVEALKAARNFKYAGVDLRDFEGMKFGDDVLYPPGQRAPEKLYCGLLGECLPSKSLGSLYQCMVDELMTEEVYNNVSGHGLLSGNFCPLGKLALKKQWADTEGVFDFLECVTENGDKLALPISPKTPQTLERLADMVNSRCESDFRTIIGQMEQENIGGETELSLLLYTKGALYILRGGIWEKTVETGRIKELGKILHNAPQVFHADGDILVVRYRDTETPEFSEDGRLLSEKDAWYNLTGEQSQWILENWDMKPYVRASYTAYDLSVE